MRNIILLIAFAFAGNGLMAQKAALKIGRKHMANLAYMDAVEHYNQYLKNEKNTDAEAIINLAEAYRKINASIEAEEWYRKAVQLPEAQPIHKLYYGMMLQRNGKCSLAETWYQQYVDAKPDDLRGQHLLRACQFEEELMSKNADVYEVASCDFNSDLDDFSPTFYKKGLVFASDRDRNPIIVRQNAWTGNPFLELYYVDARDQSRGDSSCGNYVFGRPEKFSNTVNTKYNDASVTFAGKGKEMYFTRNNFNKGDKGTDDEGVMKLKIYKAASEGEGEWAVPEELPFNSNEYNVAHPALTPDGGRLYFASDMPGGFGGMDLYYSDKEGSGWGPAMNLGPEVNTEGHELFPAVSTDGKVYFASDGLVGLGGLDIFFIKEKEEGVWTSPENLGFPMNTIADDFGIVFNEAGTCGFFSSDRAGGAGRDDIYSFKKLSTPVEVFVFDESNEQPIEGATVNLECKGLTMTTDVDGKISFDMKMNECCNFVATMEEYEEASKEGCTKGIVMGETVIVEIPMKRMAQFQLEGVVFDQESGFFVEDALVTLTNEDTGETVSELLLEPTDEGRFYFELEEGVCYKVKAEKQGFLADWQDNICTKDLTDSKKFLHNLYLSPIGSAVIPPKKEYNDPRIVGYDEDGNPLDEDGNIIEDPVITDPIPDPPVDFGTETDYVHYDIVSQLWIDKATGLPADGEYPDGRIYEKGVDPSGVDVPIHITNGLVSYLINIYYDFDEYSIRDDAEEGLQKLYETLTNNPDIIIEIGSHTDARGSTQYNIRLSKKRANSVVEWLLDKGISEERLVAKGYGETLKVNNCANFVPCTEREHQLNRRTEFKVIGCLECEDPAAKQREFAPKAPETSNIKVDECTSCPF